MELIAKSEDERNFACANCLYGDICEQGLNKLFGNQTEIDWVDAGSSMAFGAITGTIEGAGENVGKNIDHFYESDETIKSMAKEIKNNSSRRMTNTWNLYYNLQNE